jgi:hypothetical protein
MSNETVETNTTSVLIKTSGTRSRIHVLVPVQSIECLFIHMLAYGLDVCIQR